MTRASGVLGLCVWLATLTTCVGSEFRGRIADVLAVRPLRFTLQSGSERYMVRAKSDAQLLRDGQKIDVGSLQVGDYVWVVGELSKENQGREVISAEKIEAATLLYGRVESLQEVTPLRLVLVDHANERTDVYFTKATELMRDGKKLDLNRLLEGQNIWVAGSPRGDALVAKYVELVDMVEGEIVGIMEIFPLRLSVKTQRGDVMVQLLKETLVTKDSHRIDPGQLREGDKVRVIGSEVAGQFLAKEIFVD